MKSTNNLTPQFWGKRKPIDYYFKNGVIVFSVVRSSGNLHYHIQQITLTSYITLEQGIVKDEAHLKQLLSIKSVDEIQYRNLEKVEQ